MPKTAVSGYKEMSSPPLVYFFLILPAGIGTGFLTVTLPFVLAKQGWSVAAIAALVAIGNSTHLWRFLWSPIVDLTFSVRTWYLIGLIPAVAAMGVLGVVPPQEGWLFTGLVLFSQVAGTIVILPLPGMIAHTVRENAQGRASGWYQAGSLGGKGALLYQILINGHGIAAQFHLGLNPLTMCFASRLGLRRLGQILIRGRWTGWGILT